jgi:hypothetical protein
MTRPRQPHIDIDLFGIDAIEPPPRRPKPGPHGYIWHSTTQELIPVLAKDDPGYEENAKVIVAAIRRWNKGKS